MDASELCKFRQKLHTTILVEYQYESISRYHLAVPASQCMRNCGKKLILSYLACRELLATGHTASKLTPSQAFRPSLSPSPFFLQRGGKKLPFFGADPFYECIRGLQYPWTPTQPQRCRGCQARFSSSIDLPCKYQICDGSEMFGVLFLQASEHVKSMPLK